MAMHTNPSSLGDSKVKQIHDFHHMFKGSRSHVLPTLVKTSNSMSIEVLRMIAEAASWKDAISAVGMLSWLL